MHEADPYRTRAIDGRGPITRCAKLRVRLNDWCAERYGIAFFVGIIALLLGILIAAIVDMGLAAERVETECTGVCQRVGEPDGLYYGNTCYCVTDHGPVPFARLGRRDGED